MNDIIVKKSKIHGKGVFANKPFKKGERVLKWKPKFLNKSDLKKLPKKDHHYVYIKKNVVLFMSKPERYVNHSDNPNTRVRGYADIAIRDITKGEEITSNYGKSNAIFDE